MHLPLCKKSEKRKASITSAASDDDALAPPLEPQPTESKQKQKKKAKLATEKEKKPLRKRLTRTVTPEDPHPQPPSPPLSRSVSAEQTADSPPGTENMLRHSSTAHSSTPSDPDISTPRRSSRLRNSIDGISEAWHKARPYIERINGTIMPLEHQGTKGYYERDGVRI